MSSAYCLWFDPEQEPSRHAHMVWRESLYDIDSGAIPKGSPHRDDAYRFIAFASDPQRQKVLSEHLSYGPVSRRAFELLPARLAGELRSSPSNIGDTLRIDTGYFYQAMCQDNRALAPLASRAIGVRYQER